MQTRSINAAHKKMFAAKLALEQCQSYEPLDLERTRKLFKELSAATDAYVAAVDDYIGKSRPNSVESSTRKPESA